MPIPPRPGGVAMATIVSSVLNMMSTAGGRVATELTAEVRSPTSGPRTPDPDGYFFEMMTVFRNASPMLSDDIEASSATVRWTMRRA